MKNTAYKKVLKELELFSLEKGSVSSRYDKSSHT